MFYQEVKMDLLQTTLKISFGDLMDSMLNKFCSMPGNGDGTDEDKKVK